ncbi:SNF7 family protein [Actinidia rufa]|uniref:SNF7 family protein n=1 Tax=Actinidia rufa TaxID=165716 RepID=A0A7J0H0S6_9ERIC|nr:SNF7 family protein [Actinidia rufa]
MKQIREALSAPIGAAANFDEDELEAELEELEEKEYGQEAKELENRLCQPATTAPAAPQHVPEARYLLVQLPVRTKMTKISSQNYRPIWHFKSCSCTEAFA